MNGSDLARLADEELLGLAAQHAGEAHGRAAASELLGRHAGRVLAWCRRYVRDRDEAMDLAQEVLISAYRALGSFESRSRFSSWLFAITRNRCLNAVRRRRHQEEVDMDTLVRLDGSPELDLELDQDRARLRGVLGRHLDPVEARALWLAAVERLPVEDITTMLQLDNRSGARGVLQRARRKLRAALTRDDLRGGA